MALRAGQLLDDKFRLTERLGEGGMGCVWAAEDTQLGRDVAVKVLGENSREAVAQKRFLREARLAAQLRSPNVAQVFAFGIHEGQPFIVMERLHGEDLERRLGRGPMAVDTVAVIVDGVCAALAEAHALDIVHRDIKPANLFFTKVGEREILKVLDFGIATRRTDSAPLTAEGTVIGTPLYMSPEQSQGERVDYRSDLWSIAVVAYEALVGDHPFASKTNWEALAAIVKRPIPPPTSLRSELPATLDDFFAKALRRTPAQRYGSADELARAFVAAANGESPDELATQDTAPIEITNGFEQAARTNADTDVVAVDEGRPPPPLRRGGLVAVAAAVALVAGIAWFTALRENTAIRAESALVPTTVTDLHVAPAARPASSDVPASPSASQSAHVTPSVRPPTPPPPVSKPRAAPRPAPASSSSPKTTPPKPKGNEFGI